MPSLEDQLDSYLRARFPLIMLTTVEEERAMQCIKTLCERTRRDAVCWDMADGFTSLSGGNHLPQVKDAAAALEEMAKLERAALFVLRDFHDCWENAAVKRKLRNVVQGFRITRKCI